MQAVDEIPESLPETLAGVEVGASLASVDKDRMFKIRAADKAGIRGKANILLSERYAWRGYLVSNAADSDAKRTTLTATQDDRVAATLTVGIDGPAGLRVDTTFPEEVAALRAAGRRLCEFTKLASSTNTDARTVLASLFHVAYIVAKGIHGCDALLMEVNPRHVAYYQRMLGCCVAGTERLIASVNAPAVMLMLDFGEARARWLRVFNDVHFRAVDRSLYQHFFNPTEEAAILQRLVRAVHKAPYRAAAVTS